MHYSFKAKVWLYPGVAAWHFLTLPKHIAADIKLKRPKTKQRGWGSVSVIVQVGNTQWKTSIFPDKISGSYLLPCKASVRKKEGIEEGSVIAVSLSVV